METTILQGLGFRVRVFLQRPFTSARHNDQGFGVQGLGYRVSAFCAPIALTKTNWKIIKGASMGATFGVLSFMPHPE